jgi:ubiquinone/menaquinone biosynthesis C-methylase UbiE
MYSVYWDQYWNTLAKSTISDYDKNIYGNTLRKDWIKIIEKYAGKHNILDLACGNGDLALIAYSVTKTKDCSNKIYAVDYANINLNEHIQGRDALDYISWLPNTRAENLPLLDGSIGLVISQFGFEYTKTSEMIITLSKVVKLDGYVNLLIHHDKSFICKQTKIEVACYNAILNDENLFITAKSLIREAAIKKGTLTSENLRNEINEKISRIHKSYNNCTAIIDFIKVLKIYLNNLKSIHKKDYWDRFDSLELAFQSHYQRLKHMNQSIYSRPKIDRLIHDFSCSGFRCLNIEVYKTDVGILGWWLSFKRL